MLVEEENGPPQTLKDRLSCVASFASRRCFVKLFAKLEEHLGRVLSIRSCFAHGRNDSEPHRDKGLPHSFLCSSPGYVFVEQVLPRELSRVWKVVHLRHVTRGGETEGRDTARHSWKQIQLVSPLKRDTVDLQNRNPIERHDVRLELVGYSTSA